MLDHIVHNTLTNFQILINLSYLVDFLEEIILIKPNSKHLPTLMDFDEYRMRGKYK